ncbi:hypothetical protein HAP48_0035140 [Bradyrhizobium septentrionale]|uniref:Uncharacterized protein n=1 Tax=Bradyrhizobium septentrionale TaxID=1404411 RepID=A0A973VZP8_9BRAD|nr:hypothetical protein [Bradyrhizobium septentrionale]UGY13770.1 hypothetical protein HAP48_0035140 [Bradyrhizobium septentrionale]
MIEINIDSSGFTQAAIELGAAVDQLPYIMARTLNDAADATRTYLINQTWPSSVQVRNQSFMRAALTTRGARAAKDNLEVTIYDKLGRANLGLHAKSGTRMAAKSALAIPPTGAVNRSARGVPQGQRPRNLKNAFRKGDVIYQRIGKNRLRLMYVLKPQAQIKRDVAFYSDFAKIMLQEMERNLTRNIGIAMRTRRVR